MSERLEGLIRDLSSSKLELANFINEYFLLQDRVEELERATNNWSRQYDELATRINFVDALNERYKQALEKAKKQLLNDDLPIDECATEAYHTIDEALEESE